MRLTSAFNWASALWHEIAHTFHLGVSRGRVPRWFTEGLAVHEERFGGNGWGADVTPAFLEAYVTGKLTALRIQGTDLRFLSETGR